MNYSRTAIWRIRDIRGSSLVELMLVCAVIAILATRGYLALTGYPQVGGATLHIAHMLWGGLLMLIAALVLFQAADRVWKPAIAIIFGIGFGLFIDEVGKFVTKDNDYFFQPAVAIMYVVMVLILLSTRLIARIDKRSPEEYLYFATETLARSWIGPISRREQQLALQYIKDSGNSSLAARKLTHALEAAAVTEDEKTSIWQPWDTFWLRCRKIVADSRFEWIIFAAVILHIISYIFVTFIMGDQTFPDSFADWINALWQAVVSILLFAGLILWVRERHYQALRLFYYAMLIMLLIGQVFIFTNDQFYGLIELSINVALLAGIRVILEAQTAGDPYQSV